MFNNELNQELTTFEHHMFEYTKLALRRLHDMALDLTVLTAAAAQNKTDVAALIVLAQKAISTPADPTLQPQLDAIAKSLSDTNASVEAELASAATPASNPAAPAASA